MIKSTPVAIKQNTNKVLYRRILFNAFRTGCYLTRSQFTILNNMCKCQPHHTQLGIANTEMCKRQWPHKKWITNKSAMRTKILNLITRFYINFEGEDKDANQFVDAIHCKNIRLVHPGTFTTVSPQVMCRTVYRLSVFCRNILCSS